MIKKSKLLCSLTSLFILLMISSNSFGNAGVISKWEFNGNLQDAAGKHDGEFKGGSPVFVDDRFGNKNSALFLEKNQYVDFGNGEALSFTDNEQDKPFTIAWWQKSEVPEKTPGRPGSPVSILVKNLEYSVSWSNAFRMGFHDDKGKIGVHSSIGLNSKAWTHIAVTYDGTGNSSGIQMYQDGKLCPSVEENSKTDKYVCMKRFPYSRLWLGKDYIGAIDDLVIYDNVLTAKEIKELYEPLLAGVGSQEKNLNFEEYNDNKSAQEKLTSITIPFVKNAPNLDGSYTEPVWETVTWYNFEYTIGAKKDENQTKFAIIHDQENIYIAVVCSEPMPEQIKCDQVDRDSNVWTDDSIEIFIDTGFSADRALYQIAINTKGVVFDQLTNRGNTKPYTSWDSNVKANIKVGKDFWGGTVAIPLASMKYAQNNYEYFRINLMRTRTTDPPKGEKREITSFSPVKNGHDSNNFSFAVVEKFPAEFAAVDILLGKTDIITEDGHLVALCNLIFNNASAITKQVDFSLGIVGDNSAQKNISLTLPQGMLKKTIALKIKKSGKSILNLRSKDAETGKLLSFAHHGIDLEYVPLKVAILRPHYKNAIFSNQKINDLIFEIKTSISEKDRQFCKIKFELMDLAGKVVITKEANVTGEAQDKFIVPISALADGNYTMHMKLVHGKTSNVLGEWQDYLYKLPYQKGQVNINEDAIVLVDNKPFVSFGLSTMGSECSLIWEASELGFNTICSLLKVTDESLPFLDAVERANLKIIVYGLPHSIEVPCFNNKKGVSDRPLTTQERQDLKAYINKYKKHASILSWYIGNEPAIPAVSLELMGDIGGIISKQDPYHPTRIVHHFQLPVFIKFSDICQLDPYPVIAKEGWLAPNPANSVLNAKRLSSGRQPIWMLSESVYWKDYGGLYGKNDTVDYRCPDFNDLRCQFFQAVIPGATGFHWYSRPWQRASSEISLKYLAKEAKIIQDLIFAPESTKVFRSLDLTKTGEDISLHLSRRDLGNQSYFFTANGLNKKMEHTFKVDIQAPKLYVAGESRTVRLEDGVFSDSFSPYGTHLYTTDKKMAETLDREMVQTLKDLELYNNPKIKPNNLAAAANGTRIEVKTLPIIGNGVEWIPPKEFMIDSNPFTYSSPNFTSMSSPGGRNKLPEWIQLTFDRPQEISTVVIDSNINEVDIQILENNEWKTVKESKSAGNLYRDTQTIKFTPVAIKELRIVAKSANGFAGLEETRLMIWEIEAYK